MEDDISCLDTDYYTVLAGSTNCYAHWVPNQAVDKIDQFVWLATKGVSCEDLEGETVYGVENCALTKSIECNNSKLERLNLGPDLICVPTMQWELA